LGPSPVGFIVLVLAGVLALTLMFAGFLISGFAAIGNRRLRTKLVVGVVAASLGTIFGILFFAPVLWPAFWSSCLQEAGPEFRYLCRKLGDSQAATGGGDPGGGGGRAGGTDVILATAGGALLVILVLMFVLAVVARRRRAASSPEVGEEENAVLQVVDESLDDLRGERDVRRAIIACYARMERALASSGGARRPHEAPLEYLTRILDGVSGSGRAARALTKLFEVAKFSVEPMAEREKQQAIGALEALRAEVRAGGG